ncbi:MAG: hypothetical protein KDA41_06705, partial [Planctomycetales bacterium]|nr:hypothetical protein [Planctomycetales bacterium]
KPAPIRPTPIPRKPQDAAEMLRFFDIDDSLLRQLIDHRPLHDDEGEAIVRVLFALPKLPAEQVEQWVEKQPDWDALIAAPHESRTKLFRLSGRVQRVRKVALVAEAAERFEFGHYFIADVLLGEDQWKAQICAREIPQAWKLDEPIDETVSLYGMFLKMADGPVFAANRIAWQPNRVEPTAGVLKDHVFLGDLGMDVGLWDEVHDRRGLLPTDRECFYQLLAAVGRTKPQHMAERAAAEFEFADLLRSPDDFHGRLLTFEGTARRASKIVVGDADIQARLDIDHYYEVYVLVNLKKKIVYKNDEGKTLEFATFPVVFCLRELPEGMPEGDKIREPVRISAVYFKLWAYDAAKMSGFEPGRQQLCPMLVGVSPEVMPRGTSYNPRVGMLIGGLFAAALVGIWIGVWRFGVEDAKFERQTLKRQFELESGQSLNEMGLDAKNEPDFRHLQ